MKFLSGFHPDPELEFLRYSFEFEYVVQNSKFVCFKGRIDLCLTNRIRICRGPRGTNETRWYCAHVPKGRELPTHPGGVLEVSTQKFKVINIMK